MQRAEINLRPVQESDLDRILAWRNSERVRSFMYTDHIITAAEHRAWFERLRGAEFPAALVFEYRGMPAGLKSFTRIDRGNNLCYWGFYLGESELPKGCGSAMGFLALEYAFERLALRKLCAEAFAFNEGSLKYHTRLGFSQEGRFVRHVLKNGRYEDVISFALFRDDWIASKQALAAAIFQEGGKDEHR